MPFSPLARSQLSPGPLPIQVREAPFSGTIASVREIRPKTKVFPGWAAPPEKSRLNPTLHAHYEAKAASSPWEGVVMDLVVRFVIGGLVVSFFAVLGDMLKPKSFAGLFSAAPSVALASLGLAVAKYGTTYAAHEARSMVLGAAGFILYAWIVSRLLFRTKLPVMAATVASLAVWLAASLALWGGFSAVTK